MTRSIALLALLFTTLGLGVGTASAHSSLVSSTPADGETLTTTPTQVELVFNQRINSSFSNVAVTAESGQRVDSGDTTVEGERVRTALDGQPGPGTYTVAYRVVSADGHPITGQYTFTVTGTPGATTSAAPAAPLSDMATPAESENPTGPSAILMVGLAALGVAAAAALFWALTRHGGKA